MNYFTGACTAEQLSKRYKELCKQHHPDRGGSNAIQAQINIQYQQALDQLSRKEACESNIAAQDSLLNLVQEHFDSIQAHVKHNQQLYRTLYKEVKCKVPGHYHNLMDEIVKMMLQ